MQFETIKKSNTPLLIVQQILDTLKSGDLKPGDKLPSERELCRMFGVGRSSVREAIRILVVMGYLESHHGKGTYLRKFDGMVDLSLDEWENSLKKVPIVDLMEARVLLEAGLVRIVAERAEPEDFEHLSALITAMDNAESDQEYLDIDLRFHMSLADMTNNVVLMKLMKTVMGELNKYKKYFLAGSPFTRSETVRLSYEFIELLKQGLVDEAETNHRKHLELVVGNWKNMNESNN